MRYMLKNAEWVSTGNQAVIIRDGSRLAVISGSAENSTDGDAFCLTDSLSSGTATGRAYLPISEQDGKSGYYGKDINGGEIFVPLGKNPVFANFEEAAGHAIFDTPVASATVHVSGVALKFMTEEEYDKLNMDQKKNLLDFAQMLDLDSLAIDYMLSGIEAENMDIKKLLNGNDFEPRL